MTKKVKVRFSDFQVGDHATFTRAFSKADFKAFAKLSGDENPLHGDQRYAAKSEFGQTIVPVHMSMSPMSMIAGMVMPGLPSLYLGHEVHAHKPVFFEQAITYSARITAINAAQRILEINVNAFDAATADVVLSATMRVRSREDEWMQSPSQVTLASGARTALVTGANGAIGAAVARRLAGQGWNLILQHRGAVSVIKDVRDACKALGAEVSTCSADLAVKTGHAKLARLAGENPTLEAVVHTASAPVSVDIEAHVPIAYGALKAIAQAALEPMLGRQRGRLILIGSTAMHQPPAGWEDYAASKGMAVNLLAGLDKKYAAYGVRGVTVAPGYVQSAFSDDLRPLDADVLLPEEVAEMVADVAGAETLFGPYVVMNAGSVRHGSYDFRDYAHTVIHGDVGGHAVGTPTVAAGMAANQTAGSNLAGFVRSFLKLPADYDMSEAALGDTPGWDSLRHLELILAVEKEFGVSFTSGEINRTHQYTSLEAVWADKAGR